MKNDALFALGTSPGSIVIKAYQKISSRMSTEWVPRKDHATKPSIVVDVTDITRTLVEKLACGELRQTFSKYQRRSVRGIGYIYGDYLAFGCGSDDDARAPPRVSPTDVALLSKLDWPSLRTMFHYYLQNGGTPYVRMSWFSRWCASSDDINECVVTCEHDFGLRMVFTIATALDPKYAAAMIWFGDKLNHSFARWYVRMKIDQSMEHVSVILHIAGIPRTRYDATFDPLCLIL